MYNRFTRRYKSNYFINRKKKYNNYILNSDDWKYKKKQIFELKGAKCERCGEIHNLTVHHGNYFSLFHEKLEDLYILCKKCHEDYHKIISSKETTNKLTEIFINSKEYLKS